MPDKPACVKCHKTGQEKNEKARSAHIAHTAKVSCQACHSAAPYRNCFSCHLSKGATSRPDFILGLSPRDKGLVTTLRTVPVVRDTFSSVGINMENFDKVPNYWDTSPHNIRKRTERTRSCEVCHVEKKGFLTKEKLIPDGSRANDALLYSIKPIKK
ncbi:MAG TPA: multiheme c-type cytochrome [Syntrophorhabdaceae bacterium]